MNDDHSDDRTTARAQPVWQGPFSYLSSIDRRHFLKSTAAGLLVAFAGGPYALAAGGEAPARPEAAFQSRWPADVERYWAGPNYWAQPLSEWRVASGRLEFVGGDGAHRTVQHLTRRLGPHRGTLDLRVLAGFVGDEAGAAGFEVGIQGPLEDYRNDAVNGEGLRGGFTSEGQLFIGERRKKVDASAGEKGAALHLTAVPERDDTYTLVLSVLDAASGMEQGQLRRAGVPARQLVGNVGLFVDFGGEETALPLEWGTPRAWFRSWEGRGSKLARHDERALGPILFNHYTLSRGTMKMTAQLAPLSHRADRHARLEVERGGRWRTVDRAPVHELARTATFRVPGWDDARDVPYRILYGYWTTEGREVRHYEGAVRRDPVDKDEIVVGGLSCAKDTAFPNTNIVQGLRHHDPDVLAFTGDQYYEETGGYVRRAAQNVPLATLDVLHRWYMHGWCYGELTRDRPSLCLLDDHDVFHANIWGEGGKTIKRLRRMAHGGFYMPPAWINAVQRMQTAHLPDPYDPTPVENGITVYYTDVLYGRVSFAVLEDRKWKTGPAGFVSTDPDTPSDWITDPSFDPVAANQPGLELLGRRQLRFLEDWTADWRGADMKAVVSQTSFAQLPTHHGRRFVKLVADLDSNGWPQTPRDEALRRMRKGFAVHIGGDQHLPMLLHYGADDWGDAPYNYCVPAVAVGWPRAFWPDHAGKNHREGMPYYTGRYRDGFYNRMTVHAVANPERNYRTDSPLAMLADKSSGYGIIRFYKPTQEITMEAWPILSDPRQGDDEQFTGWPKTIAMQDNYARQAAAYLPKIHVHGTRDPMVQVINEEHGEVVYSLRIVGQTFRPKVFQAGGRYTIRVGDEETWQTSIEGVCPDEEGSLDVHV
jgi:hypothetical protein